MKGSKDLKEMDKKVVGLEEKQKHAESRYKKLKKSVQDVSVLAVDLLPNWPYC